MKINPSSIDAPVSGKDTKAPVDAPAAKAAAAYPRSGGDRVDLSPLSTQIAALESSLSADAGFDRARVEAIKQAIVEGRLTVSADVVADKMVASALAMLGRAAR